VLICVFDKPTLITPLKKRVCDKRAEGARKKIAAAKQAGTYIDFSGIGMRGHPVVITDDGFTCGSTHGLIDPLSFLSQSHARAALVEYVSRKLLSSEIPEFGDIVVDSDIHLPRCNVGRRSPVCSAGTRGCTTDPCALWAQSHELCRARGRQCSACHAPLKLGHMRCHTGQYGWLDPYGALASDPGEEPRMVQYCAELLRANPKCTITVRSNDGDVLAVLTHGLWNLLAQRVPGSSDGPRVLWQCKPSEAVDVGMLVAKMMREGVKRSGALSAFILLGTDYFERKGLLRNVSIMSIWKHAMDIDIPHPSKIPDTADGNKTIVQQFIVAACRVYHEGLWSRNQVYLDTAARDTLTRCSGRIREMSMEDMTAVEELHEVSRRLGAQKYAVPSPASDCWASASREFVENYRYWAGIVPLPIPVEAARASCTKERTPIESESATGTHRGPHADNPPATSPVGTPSSSHSTGMPDLELEPACGGGGGYPDSVTTLDEPRARDTTCACDEDAQAGPKRRRPNPITVTSDTTASVQSIHVR
jgi:hypothetical protein